MKNKSILKFLPLGLIAASMMFSCTDLEVQPTDSEFIQEKDGTLLITGATDLLSTNYNDLSAFTDQANIYSLGTHTSDEMIPPTRGVDWGDNGVWRTLHAHTWDPAHSFVNNSWNQLNERVFRCNRTLAATDITPAIEAEAKFLRALHMFHILDYWGQVPFREVTEGADIDPKVFSGSEAYDFILKDLNEALSILPSTGPSSDNITANRAAANTLLAKLILNKEVFTGTAGDYNAVVAACDAVTADGYAIEEDYYDNFNPNETSEVILASVGGSGQNRILMTLHYSQNPSGWNGFTTLAEFYDKFEDGDIRKSAESPNALGEDFHGIKLGLLEGQQFQDDGSILDDSRTGMPLIFTRDVPLAGASTDKGIRVMKYHPSTFADTKYVILRYGDVVLMKAEAQLRGGDAGAALATVNDLRAKRGAAALGSLNEAEMLDERGREMYWEGGRRTDLIRFGKFTEAWSEKPASEAFRNKFPIPSLALASNPNLKQNDGY